MSVDVEVQVDIARPVEVVAAYASDPDNAPSWYANIRSVSWRTTPPLRVGSEISFVASFLGRRLAYTYRVVEHDPGRRLVMETADGPFAMRTAYGWEPVPGGTRMTLRNTGSPSGFAAMSAPLLAAAMRRATTKDLQRLKTLLEA